jgi:hypothetical protein
MHACVHIRWNETHTRKCYDRYVFLNLTHMVKVGTETPENTRLRCFHTFVCVKIMDAFARFHAYIVCFQGDTSEYQNSMLYLTRHRVFYIHAFAVSPNTCAFYLNAGVIFITHTCVAYIRLRSNIRHTCHVYSKGVSWISTYSRLYLTHLCRMWTDVLYLSRIRVFNIHRVVGLPGWYAQIPYACAC